VLVGEYTRLRVGAKVRLKLWNVLRRVFVSPVTVHSVLDMYSMCIRPYGCKLRVNEVEHGDVIG
jgi:hypothetical protein